MTVMAPRTRRRAVVGGEWVKTSRSPRVLVITALSLLGAAALGGTGHLRLSVLLLALTGLVLGAATMGLELSGGAWNLLVGRSRGKMRLLGAKLAIVAMMLLGVTLLAFGLALLVAHAKASPAVSLAAAAYLGSVVCAAAGMAAVFVLARLRRQTPRF